MPLRPAFATVYVVMPGCAHFVDPEKARRRSSDVVVPVSRASDLHGRTLAPGDRIHYAPGFAAHPEAQGILLELRRFSEPRLMRAQARHAEEHRRLLVDLGLAS